MRKPQIESDIPGLKANPGYAMGQLARAYATRDSHADEGVRERAGKKADTWFKILQDMLSGALNIGSRTPVLNTPAWATLEVAHGGFATGNLAAGGVLLPHETQILGRIASPPSASPRASINSYYISDDGLLELQSMLESGHYRVGVPEEGALLTVAWLLRNDQADAALGILDHIAPYFDKLRFYPIPAQAPPVERSLVYLQTAGQVAKSLQGIRVRTSVTIQREAMLVWMPLVDRIVDLFLQTVEGPPPTLKLGEDGKPLRGENGKYAIEGGWPCQHYGDEWRQRARAVLAEFAETRKHHKLYRKVDHKGENIAILRKFLAVCVQNTKQLTGREVGLIRLALAGYITRRGTPNSEQCRQIRERQTELARLPGSAELARVVAGRLAAAAPDEPLENVDDILGPVNAGEAEAYGVPVNHDVAKRLGGKVMRCLAASPETLVWKRIVTSGEVLATIARQMTAQLRASRFADADLRRLYGQVYEAFRKRRSLLLLNLASQIKLGELPWVSAIDGLRATDEEAKQEARRALSQVADLAVRAFPDQILPNKLLQEMRALAADAGLHIPFVDELAADIFMGAFGEKFLRSAQIAAALLEGTLYERYYGISYERIRKIDDIVTTLPLVRPPVSQAFYNICAEMAGPHQDYASVARNGMIIEQEQILTTHNLAVLFAPLREDSGPGKRTGATQPIVVLNTAKEPSPDSPWTDSGDLAVNCFIQICRRNRQMPADWKKRLQMIKNSAYAWRQMILFLALLPQREIVEFYSWASEDLAKQSPELQARLAPAMLGLKRAIDGLPTEASGDENGKGEAKRFLGWTTGKHWMG